MTCTEKMSAPTI